MKGQIREALHESRVHPVVSNTPFEGRALRQCSLPTVSPGVDADCSLFWNCAPGHIKASLRQSQLCNLEGPLQSEKIGLLA